MPSSRSLGAASAVRLVPLLLAAFSTPACGTPHRELEAPTAVVPPPAARPGPIAAIDATDATEATAAPPAPPTKASCPRRGVAIRGDHELGVQEGAVERRFPFPGVFLAQALPDPCGLFAVVLVSDQERHTEAHELTVPEHDLAAQAFLFDLSTGGRRALTDPASTDNHIAASWSPDGGHLAFLTGQYGPIALLATADAEPWIASDRGLRTVKAPPHVIHVDGEEIEVAQRHDLVRWDGEQAIVFSAGCCYPPVTYRYTIGTGRIAELGFARH